MGAGGTVCPALQVCVPGVFRPTVRTVGARCAIPVRLIMRVVVAAVECYAKDVY